MSEKEMETMTEKEKNILDKAEDVILRKMEQYLKAPEDMTDKDCYNFQLLVITTGRIKSIREGTDRTVFPAG